LTGGIFLARRLESVLPKTTDFDSISGTEWRE